jgi:hypothetical protein
MRRAPAAAAARAKATTVSRSTARKASCEPACRIVVPSADTAASGSSEETIAGHSDAGATCSRQRW